MKFALLISCAMLAGCATTQPVQQTQPSPERVHFTTPEEMQAKAIAEREDRAREYATKHPNAPTELLRCFAEGKIKAGMTREQAQVVMGPPRRKIESGGVGGTTETWVFGESDYAYLFFSEDVLVRWQFQ